MLKGELDQLRLATNELTITSKDEAATNLTVTNLSIDTGVPIAYGTGIAAGTAQQLPTKSQVEGWISTAKNSVTKIVDDNADAPGNDYQLKITNNQLEFSRNNDATADTWLRLFGTTTGGTDGVVQQTNRSNFFFESDDVTSDINNIYLRHGFNADPASLY